MLATQGIHQSGFQRNLQAPDSLARAVTVDSEVNTKTRPLHTLNVVNNRKGDLD